MKRFKHLFNGIVSVCLLALFGGLNSANAQCPNVTLTANKSEECIPAPINFSVQNLPGNASSITWNWSSDDSLQSNNTNNQSHTYRDAGDVEPSIIIYDDNGNRICEVGLGSSGDGTISINANPTADFSVSGGAQCFDDNSYTFSDESSQGSGPITNWQWTFGDGNSSNQQNPTHTYQQPVNNPNIVLQVTDANGCTDLVQRQEPSIEVFDPLNPRFTVSGKNPDCPETEVTLNNQTPNRRQITKIKFDFDDTANTSRTFTQGPNGWDAADFNQTQFTYKAPGTYEPSLTVTAEKGNVTCDETFTFSRGVVNVVFRFDSSIVTNPVLCEPPVPFSHTPDANSQQFFTFGSLQDGVGPFAPHMPPPNPVERGIWSGSHEYPSGGVKSIRLDVTNICGVLDTLYRKQAVIEGPAAAITLPDPPFPLASRREPQDQPISKRAFQRANKQGCLQVNGINYVRRNGNGGFTTPPQTWTPGDAKIGTPADTFPYRMVFFNKRSDILTDAPKVGDTVAFERYELADTVVFNSVSVDFVGRNLSYTPGNGIKVSKIGPPDTNAAIIEFTQAPSNPPFQYRIRYQVGDSTVYRPATGASLPQNMHDTDIFKPNCQAPNLVKFTNNSQKNRAFRGPNGQIQKREFFHINREKSDSIYRTFTNNLGLQDTLYYHFYEGYDIPGVTDNGAFFQVNDSSNAQFNNRIIPFDHNLPYLDVLDEGQGAHGLRLSTYLNLIQQAGYLSGGIDTDSVGLGADEGFNDRFDWASSFGANNPTIRGFYEEDFKDTFVEDKNDDLSPWGSDSLNYVWNFADPNGAQCTTRTAWASKQKNFLYREFEDTVVVGQVNNGVAEIPLNLPADYNDTLAKNKTRINVFPRIPLSSLNNYGDGYDVEFQNGTPTLRIWNGIAQGDSVAVKFFAGDDEFAGRNCNFSTAAAPYHYYDTSGCWQAILQAEDTVTGCPPATAVQRIFMGPPRADWGKEALIEGRSKTLTTGFNFGNSSFLLDSLGLACDIQEKAAKVLTDSGVRVVVNNNILLNPSSYQIEQDSVARLVIQNTNNIPIGAKISAQYEVKEYAIIEGDTFDIKNMSRDIQKKLPEWDDGDPESVIRRGLIVEGLGCEGEDQEIIVEETLPAGQCDGTQSWGLIIDSASTVERKPGFQGGPFGWKTNNPLECADTLDIDGDGNFETVQRKKPTFNWIPKMAWDMFQPRRTYSYDTSGCVDVGFWVENGNCVDTHFYRNYKFIADLESEFSALNPDTLSPSPENRFGPYTANQQGVFQNSSYCPERVGDTTNLLVSPLRDQERIKSYEISHFGAFLTHKKRFNPYTINDSTEVTDYDNLLEDTVYVLCDSLRIDQIQIPGGGTRNDTVCVNRNLFPERVCGESAINDQTLESLRTPDTIRTGCGSNQNVRVTSGKVVIDSFPLINMGGVIKRDSFNHTEIGGPNNPQIIDVLPERSKLYEYSIFVDNSFGLQDTVHLVSIENLNTRNVTDTILTFPNDNFNLTQLDSAFGEPLNYLGVIEDSSDIVGSLNDTTYLALAKNGATQQGAISFELRYKPVVSDIPTDKPGIYRLSSSIENAKGCGDASNPRFLEVGHYGRFDPEVIGKDNDTVICSNSKNDTVYFYNKLTAPNPTVQNMGIFPRYYDFRPPLFPGQPPIFLADDNFWKDPKGVRDNPLTDGHQYEQLFWDLNGDGYFETKYDIDSLKYVQDLNKDSTFEQVLDSVDVNGDGITEVVPYFVYDSAGRFDVSMKSIDSTGCKQIMEKEDLVTVTGLQAFIDTLPSGLACAPVSVDFFDNSELSFQFDFEFDSAGNPIDSTKVDSVVSWNWKFNDGKDSINNFITDTVTKFFTRNDTFQIELKVESAAGCVDSSVLSRRGGDSVVVKSGDTLSRNAEPMVIEVLGPNPKLALQSKLQCQPAVFKFKDSSESVTEWVFDKGNGEEVTVSQGNFPADSFFRINYDDAGTYNLDIEVFGQVPNTSTDNPNDSFRCRAPVQDTTLPTFDSNRFKVRVKATNEVDFAINFQDLCPPENIGNNPNTQLSFTEQADPAYDSFFWAMGQGDTLSRQGDFVADGYTQFYDANKFDTFDITLIPNGEDTLCFDTAVKPLRITAVNNELDTLAQPQDEDRPRSRYTFTSETEFAESFDWHFFNASVQEAGLENAINNETGYYTNAPGNGNKLETDSAELEPVVDYYTDRGFYWTALRAFNPQGCHITDTIKIANVKDTVYDRSNVFTPNGDGTNDRFTFRVQGDRSFKLEIYNRWGESVYETTSNSSNNNCFWSNNRPNFNGECGEDGKDPSNPRGCKYCEFWDGTSDGGGDAPAGTYFYKITYEFEETEDGRGGFGDSQTGTVTLIR